MADSIVTGRKIVNVGKGSEKDPNYNVLFDQKSTKRISHFVHIEPKQAIQFSTFGLPDGAKLTVHRVLPDAGAMPQGAGCVCDYDEGKAVMPMVNEPLKINCKTVVLDNCNNVLFLTIPGSYMLELNDEAHLGLFWAFAEAMCCDCLPDGLVIGNTVNGSYVGVATND